MSPKTLEQFLHFTVKRGECLEWTRCINSDGYARCAWNGSTNGKVHRIVYSLANPEEDISKKVIRHSCDNLICINPVHLLSGTPADNDFDRDVRGRHGMAKLCPWKARRIRALKERHPDITLKMLGEMFGVNYRTIGCVLKNQTWAWIDLPEAIGV